MLFEKKKIFSLTRFFHEKPELPCWLAGRFFEKDSNHYFLKSQGKFIVCKKDSFSKKVKQGDWLAVYLLSQNMKSLGNNKDEKIFKKESSFLESVYLTKACYILNRPEDFYIEKNFSYKKKGQVLQKWHFFLRAVEGFFISKGLSFASTPHLVECPGTEPHLKPLKSSYRNYYLATSPEIHLKKLLCQDWTDFFEIKTCFREEENNSTHQIEFSLLEWYRAFYSLKDLMTELYELILFLKKKGFCKRDIPSPQFFSVSELFQKYLNFPLTPQSSKKELLNLATKQGLFVSSSLNFEDLFFLIFLNKIEPQLCQKNPFFIYNYPPQLRAFSQINKEGWAQRFEFYWQGLELANAFYEVTDFKEQRNLFQEHLEQRQDDILLDENLLDLMKKTAMPPSCGIAVGLDRLFLAFTEEKDLRKMRLFPS